MTASDPSALDPSSRLRREASELALRLRAESGTAVVASAKKVMDELRELREFRMLGRLAEEVSRHEPGDTKVRRLYAQSLIETGRATAAIDVLGALAERVGRASPEWPEAMGLLGRAYKQIFFDSGDKDSAAAQEALRRAIEHYRAPFDYDPERNCWHGVNVAALARKLRVTGTRSARDPDPRRIAQGIVATLAETPVDRRDNWYHATAAEAHLALDQWDEVERHIGSYVRDARTTAFNLGSTLRQFTEVWDLDRKQAPDPARGIVSALRAQTLAAAAQRPQRSDQPGGVVRLDPQQVQRAAREPEPPASQLQAILGSSGPMTYRWWRTGLERARGVASIRTKLGDRFGTGFLLRGGDFAPSYGNELMVLTNWHVVNDRGDGTGRPPDTIEVSFEAERQDKTYRVAGIAWSSPVNRHDATMLRLAEQPGELSAMPLARSLPDVGAGAKPRVYAIGHPGGRDLSFSFQDNELLDHEGPPHGNPVDAAVCRVHYRTPTEPGSSGSPVFNPDWDVLALHHAGGRTTARLNGLSGVWEANEGITLDCIACAMRQAPGG